MTPSLLTVALLVAQAAGYDGRMSVGEPAGVQAERIHALGVFLGVVAAVVTVLVAAVAWWGALRRRRAAAAVRDAGHAARLLSDDERARERRAARWVGGAVAATIAILVVVVVVDFGTGRAIATMPDADRALNVEVVGHQWWWEVRYGDPQPSRRLTTANEIHVPVGRPVLLKLTSRDVIHSFWAPNLHGKKDLVPGHSSFTWFRADTAGVYRGQCAEYCGHQHAKMSFVIVARSPAEFATWYEQQLRPAAPPADSLRRAGEQLFQAKGCVLCHTIRGTRAGGRLGPELTHLASRRTLAAGTLPNTRGHLAGWIVDPQRIKPGVRMPANQLEPKELEALLAYLEGLR